MTAIKITSEVDEAAWNELCDPARDTHRSVSEVLSEAIEEYLARRRVRPDVLRHLENSVRENDELGKLPEQKLVLGADQAWNGFRRVRVSTT